MLPRGSRCIAGIMLRGLRLLSRVDLYASYLPEDGLVARQRVNIVRLGGESTIGAGFV